MVENLINNRFSFDVSLITPIMILEETSEILYGEKIAFSFETITLINSIFGYSLYDWEITKKYSLLTISLNSIIMVLSQLDADDNYLAFLDVFLNYYFPGEIESLTKCKFEIEEMAEEDDVDSMEIN